VTAVVLVSRDFALLEGGNSAPVLAGLGLPDAVPVREQLGGAPDALDAVLAADPGTLVIGVDTTNGAGASAVFVDTTGAPLIAKGAITRSLPVVTRARDGATTDYADPRLLREMGVRVSLSELELELGASEAPTAPIGAVAGVAPRDAAALGDGDVPVLPTRGASAAGFALAALVEAGATPVNLLAIEQATIALAELGAGPVAILRDEPEGVAPPVTRMTSDAEISISLAAYARAFDAKLRLEAARCTVCGTLSYPHRFRCIVCGSEGPTETVALPRDAEIYTLATIHVPVPGLSTPYTVVVVELGDTGVRLLARLTGALPGSVAIGDRGHMVLRKVAVRTGVPDYGYAFLPDVAVGADEQMAVSA
jgi:uncharacterized OB-fold protein